VNGKKAKFLRKQLSIKKDEAEATESGLFTDHDAYGNPVVKFRKRSNPSMRIYRHVKRVITRGK